MQNRRPSRKRHGNTAPAQGETQKRSPRAPHEHDESADSQATDEPSSQRVGQAAREDVERGVVDTDTGPVLDQTYDKVREDAGDPIKKLGP